MGVVSEMCDEVNVMYSAQVIESGKAEEFFKHYRHPYTAGLLNSIPQGKTKTHKLASIPGNVKPFLDSPKSCVFLDRCVHKDERCSAGMPKMLDQKNAVSTACFRADELQLNLPE